VLEELLDFLEGRGAAGAEADGSRPAEELRTTREELAALRQLEETLRSESAAWESRAEAARASGDGDGELEAMRKVFDARERRSNIRRRALRAEERVEYLEKVVFELERKRQGRSQADSPGTYAVLHDRTKVAATAALSDSWLAELPKGTLVEVSEVVCREQDKRVRGRLESPAGWISLLNTETGYRWAERRAPAAPGASGAAEPKAPARPDFDANAALAELKRRRAGER